MQFLEGTCPSGHLIRSYVLQKMYGGTQVGFYRQSDPNSRSTFKYILYMVYLITLAKKLMVGYPKMMGLGNFRLRLQIWPVLVY